MGDGREAAISSVNSITEKRSPYPVALSGCRCWGLSARGALPQQLMPFFCILFRADTVLFRSCLRRTRTPAILFDVGPGQTRSAQNNACIHGCSCAAMHHRHL